MINDFEYDTLNNLYELLCNLSKLIDKFGTYLWDKRMKTEKANEYKRVYDTICVISENIDDCIDRMLEL